METWMVVGIGIVGLVVFLMGIAALIMKFYRKVDQGQALIVNTMREEPTVTFTGATVYPIVHRAEIMDISVKTLEIDRRGSDGLICQDNIRADIKVTFYVRVNKTRDDVLKVAQSVGCKRASDQQTLDELFSAKFSEGLKTVGKQLDFESLYIKRNEFKDRIIEVIGTDLNGYVLDDAAIDYLEQTPLSQLDETNILDAQGIRKITMITAGEQEKTRQREVERQTKFYELEFQERDAEAKQKREIAAVQAREAAEASKVQSEERLKSETARIKVEEDLAIQEENKMRQVEVAQKNRERVIGVETERVQKERDLEAVGRERAVDVQRVSKDTAIEEEIKKKTEVVRERVAIQKTVAEEEERIKYLRLVEEAKRTKEAVIIAAEGQAQEQLVKDIKEAEAAEQASKFKAKEQLTLAEAELESTDKLAQAKIRMSEGVKAELAASGLAEVHVREAGALAIEKQGLAEARVSQEKLQAQAKGEEAVGHSQVRVKEADAAATEKVGLAEAIVIREKGISQAAASKEMGLAEAEIIGQKIEAEAAGIMEKAKSMKALDDASRGHEEFRLTLDKQKTIELEAIKSQVEIADRQARMLGEALGNANIDIVGGTDMFVDKLLGAITMGKTVDGFFNGSKKASTVLSDYLSGDASLREDLKDILSRPALSSGDVQNLSVAAILGRLMAGSDAEGRDKLTQLLDQAKKLGVDKLSAS